jgi:hypothetical protein
MWDTQELETAHASRAVPRIIEKIPRKSSFLPDLPLPLFQRFGMN